MEPIVPDFQKAQEADESWQQYRWKVWFERWGSLILFLLLMWALLEIVDSKWWLGSILNFAGFLVLFICWIIAGSFHIASSVGQSMVEGYNEAFEKHFGKSKKKT